MKGKTKTLILFWTGLLFIVGYLIFAVDWVGYDEIVEQIDEQNEIQLYDGQKLIGEIYNIQSDGGGNPSEYPFYIYYRINNDDLLTKSLNPQGFGMVDSKTEFVFESGQTISDLEGVISFLYEGMNVEADISVSEELFLKGPGTLINPHYIQKIFLYDLVGNTEAVKSVLANDAEKITVVSFFDTRNDTHSFLHSINRLYPNLIEAVQFFDVNYANSLYVMNFFEMAEAPIIGVFNNDDLLFQTNDPEALYSYLNKLSDD